MTPPNVPEAFDSPSVLLPSATAPLPERLLIVVLKVVRPAIENTPLSLTPLDAEIEPLPASARVPLDIVVAPEIWKLLAIVKFVPLTNDRVVPAASDTMPEPNAPLLPATSEPDSTLV